MPSPLFLPDTSHLDGSLWERVLGPSAKQRSTKTWIPSTGLVQRLGVLRQHSQRLLKRFAKLEAKRGNILTDDELRAKYLSIAAYEGLHQELTEHLTSYKGFSLRALNGEAPDLDGKPRKDSSAGADTPAPQPAPTPAPAAPTQQTQPMAMR